MSLSIYFTASYMRSLLWNLNDSKSVTAFLIFSSLENIYHRNSAMFDTECGLLLQYKSNTNCSYPASTLADRFSPSF